jgi:uncharacterized protein (TIGR00290 family)
MKEQAIVCWSGGKDCALALNDTRLQYDIVSLLTTVTRGYDRISMHGVRVDLLVNQGRSLGQAVEQVTISPTCSNEEYEAGMRLAFDRYRQAGVTAVICGDIFLEDVRRYREKLFPAGLTGVFPLWKRDTAELARRFIVSGFRAVVCCVDTQVLDATFAGRLFDETFVEQLPPGVDPCGENGEFHTFVFDGPGMTQPLAWRRGEQVLRDKRFQYCDLLPIAS